METGPMVGPLTFWSHPETLHKSKKVMRTCCFTSRMGVLPPGSGQVSPASGSLHVQAVMVLDGDLFKLLIWTGQCLGDEKMPKFKWK